ncbi:bacterial extracellular solute-binding s, 3 family protein, partial [Vibrio parahaemolyticus VPTS-2010]
RFKFKSN